MPKIEFKRGLKSTMPTLNVAEPGFTTDTEEFFIGTAEGNNIQFAKQSDLDIVNAHGEEIIEARGPFSLLGDRLDGVDEDLADIATVNNHSITYGYDTNGNVQTVTEKDSSNNVIKTVTYTYNTSGDVATSVTVMNGKTVTTTYNYDASSNITSTVNALS